MFARCVERLRRQRVERVVQTRVERARAARLGALRPRPRRRAPRGRMPRRRAARPHRGEATGERGRDAARAGDRREQRIAVRDGQRAAFRPRRGRRRRSPTATTPSCVAAVRAIVAPLPRRRRSPRRRGSPPRGPRARRPRPRCRARSRRRPRRGSASPSRCETSSRRRRRDRGRPARPRRSPPCPASSIASIHCARERADVEDERARRGGHLLDLFDGMRHDRQRTDRERRVRRLVHDDVVRDLVDQRLPLAQVAQRRAGRVAHRPSCRWKTSTGPSPAPRSASPCATASLAVAAATIAAAEQVLAAGEQRRERCRVRAARAVRRAAVVPPHRDRRAPSRRRRTRLPRRCR